jgi:hypothetical protein
MTLTFTIGSCFIIATAVIKHFTRCLFLLFDTNYLQRWEENLSYPDLAHETCWQFSGVDILSVVRELQHGRVDFSSVYMILFDLESRVQCSAEPRGQLGFWWLLWSAVDWNGVVCVSVQYGPDDEINPAFQKFMH